MEIWQAIVLGIVQGASEFLPISSSGHLLLLEKLGIGCESLFFNVVLHLGTLFAVMIALRKSLFEYLKHPIKKGGYALVACIPTVALALIFKFAFPTLLSGKLLGFSFVLTSCLLVLGEKFSNTQNRTLSIKNSILTGVFQGIAVLPGVSRSGSTIAALSLCGVEKSSAADFSFVLSIPIIIGSALLEGGEIILQKSTLDIGILPLILGAVFAFVTGLVSIKFFLKFVKKHTLLPFAFYTLTLGIITTLLPLFDVNI